MPYLVSFMAGALGWAIFDKSTDSDSKGLNLVKLGAEVLAVYWLFKKLK